MLSVIIPTRNRAKLLMRTLDGISKVDFPADDYEVIVTDTGSTDGTAEACREFAHQKRMANFRYERCSKPGLHVGRHRGAKVAAGDILVFVDDDIFPLSTWLAAIAESFRNPDVDLVGGNDLPDLESAAPPWFDEIWVESEYGRWSGHYSLIEFGSKAKEIPPQFVFGCNFSIRKSALVAGGGFHPDGMPSELLRYRGDGETAVSWSIKRSGRKTHFHPGASVRHWVSSQRLTPQYLGQRGYIQGISDSYSKVRQHGGVDHPDRIRECARAIKRALFGLREHDGVSRWFREGFQKGYRYHQEQVASDPALLEWVLRKDYWEEQTSPG